MKRILLCLLFASIHAQAIVIVRPIIIPRVPVVAPRPVIMPKPAVPAPKPAPKVVPAVAQEPPRATTPVYPVVVPHRRKCDDQKKDDCK